MSTVRQAYINGKFVNQDPFPTSSSNKSYYLGLKSKIFGQDNKIKFGLNSLVTP